MREVLLLTATVAPRAGAALLSHSSPSERLQDYVAALRFYLPMVEDGTFSSLVFVENSGHGLDTIKKVVDGSVCRANVEVIHVEPSIAADSSRFALELDLLAQSAVSWCLPEGRNVRFWKVTGRYIIGNLRQIVQAAPSSATGYFHSRRFPKKWTEFYIAAFTSGCFNDVLIRNKHILASHENGEEALYQVVVNHPPASHEICARMKLIPSLKGRRGLDGREYADLRGRAGYWFRCTINSLLPGLWI